MCVEGRVRGGLDGRQAAPAQLGAQEPGSCPRQGSAQPKSWGQQCFSFLEMSGREQHTWWHGTPM